MKTEQQSTDFDFKKIVTTPIQKLEKQSYSKLFFLTIGLSVFMTLGISIKDSIGYSITKTEAVNSKKLTLSLQEIKKMPDIEFDLMTKYIMKNSNIYDAKVNYIQSIIAKSEIENYEKSMSTSSASTLGNLLDSYKQTLVEDASKLIMIRKNVMNDLPISNDESELFFKYQILYNTKSIIHSKDLNDKMQDLLYSNNKGNNTYNNKYNIYQAIKSYDSTINNTFNTIDTPKPKI